MAFSEPMIGGTQACGEERVSDTRRRWLLPLIRRLRFGLAARLALYTAILGTVVTAVLTSYMYQGSVDALITGELHELAATNQAAGLQAQHQDCVRPRGRADPCPAARACRGCAHPSDRRRRSGRRLPAGSRTSPAWRRPSAPCSKGRPGYIQLRYIAADGREVVRLRTIARRRDSTLRPGRP